MLDSLNRYEFLKARTVQLRTDLQDVNKARLGLRIELVRANVRAEKCETAAAPLQAKLKAARAEVWVWRGVGALSLLKLTVDLLNVFK